MTLKFYNFSRRKERDTKRRKGQRKKKRRERMKREGDEENMCLLANLCVGLCIWGGFKKM